MIRKFRDRVLRNKRYKLYVNSKRALEKFFDLLVDETGSNNLIDSLNTEARKNNFSQLYEVVQTFPKKDNDPKYKPNPPQIWDVKVIRENQVWKK